MASVSPNEFLLRQRTEFCWQLPHSIRRERETMNAALDLPALNGAAVVLLVVVVAAWGRHRGRRVIASLGLVASAGVAVRYFS